MLTANGYSIICSCRTQSQVEKFISSYENDIDSIKWRAAIITQPTEEIERQIESDMIISAKETTCYVDYEQPKKAKRIGEN